MDRIFRALADSTRRDILQRTIGAEQSVSALAAAYEISFAAVQKHVAVLEAARLVVKRAEGRERLVRAEPTTIARARRLLDRYEHLWRARIDRLDALLAEDATETNDATDAAETNDAADAAEPDAPEPDAPDAPEPKDAAEPDKKAEVRDAGGLAASVAPTVP